MKEFNKVDLGSVKIHKKVIAEIAYNAIEELDGIRLGKGNFLNGLAELFNVSSGYPGVSIIIDKNNQVIVDVRVSVRYGINIPDAAKQAQDVVRRAIERTVDIDLKDVNVNIQGIEKGES